MRIQDIISLSIGSKVRGNFPSPTFHKKSEHVTDDKFAIAKLIDSDVCGDLSICPLIKKDELDMARVILGMAYNCPGYQPSPLALEVAKTVTDKVAAYDLWLSHD